MDSKDLKSYFEKSNERFREAADVINQMADAAVVTIPESVFVSKLLPIMKEWVINKRADNLHLWIIAAGGPERPIHVSLGDGEYFIVPPPYNHPGTLGARNHRENGQIHAIAELMTRRQSDGETREVMRLGSQIEEMLSTEQDLASHARYTIMLAKVWERYELPVEQVLSDLKLDLSLYNREGYYVLKDNPSQAVGGESIDADDEFEF